MGSIEVMGGFAWNASSSWAHVVSIITLDYSIRYFHCCTRGAFSYPVTAATDDKLQYPLRTLESTWATVITASTLRVLQSEVKKDAHSA